MFLRAAAAHCPHDGSCGLAGEALAQFMPGPPAWRRRRRCGRCRRLPSMTTTICRPTIRRPDIAVRRRRPMASRSAPTSRRRCRRPVRMAPRPAIRRARAGLSAATQSAPYPPPRGQYGAAPGYPPAREPAYGPPPGYEQDPRGPAGRPQYGAVPPQQRRRHPSADGCRPRRSARRQPSPDITSRLPTDDRPETGPRKELPPQFRRTHGRVPHPRAGRHHHHRYRRTRISISCSATARRCATASASAAKASPGRAPSASPAWPSGRTGIRRRK